MSELLSAAHDRLIGPNFIGETVGDKDSAVMAMRQERDTLTERLNQYNKSILFN